MKILLVHNFYRQPGGEDATFQAEKRILSACGHQISEYSRRNVDVRDDRILTTAKLGFHTIWAGNSTIEMRNILKREKPDIAHFHNTFPLISPAAYYPCQEAGVPVVQTLHNYRLLCPAATFYRAGKVCKDCVSHSLWRGLASACYRDSRPATATVMLMLAMHRHFKTWASLVNRYIAPSDVVRREFVQAGFPSEKISVKPHFVPRDPGTSFETGEYALFVGRLSQEKGVRTLLAAWRLLQDGPPLRIVGAGPLAAELETRRDDDSLSNVSFHGWLPPEQVQFTMRRAAFLVFPSEWQEPFGLAVIEAFACGIPVLASGLGAPAEIVEHGRTGLHFAAGDVSDLAAKVHWAWTHPMEMKKMGAAARAEYEANYTAERNQILLTQLYRDVIRRSERRKLRMSSAPPSARRQALPL